MALGFAAFVAAVVVVVVGGRDLHVVSALRVTVGGDTSAAKTAVTPMFASQCTLVGQSTARFTRLHPVPKSDGRFGEILLSILASARPPTRAHLCGW